MPRIAGRRWLLGMWLWTSSPLWAATTVPTPDEPAMRIAVTAEPGLITLEARDAPLRLALDELARKTGARVHYTILPENRVTALCAGESVKAVMRCVLGAEADLMFRSRSEGSKNGAGRHALDVWVLGSSFAKARSAPDGRDSAGCPTAAAKTPEPDDIQPWLEMARTGDPAQRANAIARLASGGRIEAGTLRATLEQALADADPSVRAQAVYGLARQGDASAELQAALHDGDPAVRLMAVDSVGASAQGLAMLREALTDSDETVSRLAALKLKSFEDPAGSRQETHQSLPPDAGPGGFNGAPSRSK